jgi:GTP cyclohydrolase II
MKQITVEKMTCARIPTEMGEFQLCHYRNDSDDKEHLALLMGDVYGQSDVMVRVHSECFTGDVLGSLRCDCGPQLNRAIQLISQAGTGVIIYLRQEGRGIGLLDKLRAYNLQDDGFDTVEANLMLGHQADSRDYTIASLILQDLGINSVHLLTNNPLKIESLQRLGVRVTSRIPLQTDVNQENAAYLQTKVSRMRHLLDLNGLSHSVANNGYVHRQQGSVQNITLKEMRPFITLSYAQSLDGSITTRRGEALAISGPESLKMTHQLRAQHDAILIGIGTVLADDPRLTVRLAEGPDPQPVIIDSQLRFPLQARLLSNPCKPWIATTESASLARQEALEVLGARIIRLPANENWQVSLPDLLIHLGQSGIKSLMVEGGALVISSFISANLADRLVLTIAPILAGGLNAISPASLTNHARLPKIKHPHYQKLGDDIVISGKFIHNPNGGL